MAVKQDYQERLRKQTEARDEVLTVTVNAESGMTEAVEKAQS